MAASKPIKIGYIGLSQNGHWAPIAHLPYLQSELGKKSYQIVALCNSSIDSAKATIAKFGLDPSTKAYDSPDDIANDPNVDLVVCVVNAPKHAPTIRPSIAAGKRIFCEWPLGKDIDETKNLFDAAKAAGISQKDLLIGLEEPWEACVDKVRETIQSGAIGRVLHSSMDVAGIPLGSYVPSSYEYALHHETGAWTATIAHTLYAITQALGPIDNCSARVINALPQANIIDPAKNMEVIKTVTKDAATHYTLAGQFKQAELGFPGASLSYQIRFDPKFGDEPMCLWRIMGKKGQLKVSMPNSPMPEFDDGSRIEHLDYATKEIVQIPWRRDATYSEDEGILAGLSGPARLIGRIYEAFAKGAHLGHADWESAVKLFELIDALVNKGEFRA